MLLITIDCTIHKEPISCVIAVQQQQQNTRCCHCGKMLYLYRLWSMRKDIEINNQPLNGMNFYLRQPKEKVLLS